MELSNVDASRILFGFTAAYHFLFVPVTIGLMALIAVFEGWALFTGRPALREAARFLAWPFLINFICGVLTGYPLRTQIELHWAGYAGVVRDVVGSVFAFEAQVAPWLFSLVAVFFLGWHLKPVCHWLVSTALAVMLVVQSSAILMINAWMQLPVGTTFAGEAARVDGLMDLADNPLLVPKILHTIGGAWVLGGMIAVSLSAWYLLRRRHVAMARSSLKAGSAFTLFSLLLTGAAGHWSGERLVRHQPMKFAAIEALWERPTPNADLLLFALPDQASEANRFALGVPGGLDWIVSDGSGPVRGLRELREDTIDAIRLQLDDGPTSAGRLPLGYATLLPDAGRGERPGEAEVEEAARRAMPNVATVFWSFRVMLMSFAVMLGLVMLLLWRRPDPDQPGGPTLLRAAVLALPLPWLAIEAGWMVCEAGRQPWTITGVLATRASVGTVPASEAVAHLILALVLGALLLAVNLKLHLVHLRRGPVPERTRGTDPERAPDRRHPPRLSPEARRS
ncbi:MAG: cytochrome ubiquinol oxidase subunit I [Rhizobacter sp.]|jgi:cytochrome d ubiquinol oxidase subunit I